MVEEDSCVCGRWVTRGDRRNGDLCGGPPGKGRVGRGLARLGIAECLNNFGWIWALGVGAPTI